MLQSLNTNRLLGRMKLKEFPEPEVIQLKHPVLLCHGYGAIATLIKPSPLYDIAMMMRGHHVLAFAPNIVPYAKIETRAGRWVTVIDDIITQTDIEKLNIVAHSMGGLDMRYALSQLEAAPYVESFTTVCTPHHGSSLAELSLRTPGAIREKIVDFLDWMGNRVHPHTESNVSESVEQLTRRYMAENFNPHVPNVEGIPYYSYSSSVGKGTGHPIKVIGRYQNNHVYEQEGLNDGMVSVESAQWGEHIGTGEISHLEQMNLRVKDERKRLVEAFWRDIILMLREKGH